MTASIATTPLPTRAAHRILLVTAADYEAQRLAGEIERSGRADQFSVTRVNDLTAAQRGSLENFDLILFDLALPGAEDAQSIAGLKSAAPGSAIIAMARFEKEPGITQALRAGASEFLVKGIYSFEPLAAILEHASERSRYASSATVSTMYSRLSRDSETGLPNAELFADLGRYAAGVAFRSGGQLAQAVIVIHSTETNDGTVPMAVATILREATRATDALARLSHDRYAVLFGPVISPGEVERVMRRICERLQRVPATLTSTEMLKVAAGVAQFPKDADSHEQLLVNAGLAALSAHRGAPGSVVMYQLGLRGGIGF
jgi:PleD family two-component response regulator